MLFQQMWLVFYLQSQLKVQKRHSCKCKSLFVIARKMNKQNKWNCFMEKHQITNGKHVDPKEFNLIFKVIDKLNLIRLSIL